MLSITGDLRGTAEYGCNRLSFRNTPQGRTLTRMNARRSDDGRKPV